jgi:hypothetical protein
MAHFRWTATQFIPYDNAKGEVNMRAHCACLGALLLSGCIGGPEPSPVARPVLELKQFMVWVIDPAADVVWESVKTIMTEDATKEVAPKTDEEWDNVRNAAAALMEAGSSLMMQGRARGADDWTQAARRLTDTARGALTAAQAKDAAAVFDAGGRIYNACAGCHRRFAPQLNAYAGPR